MAGTLESRARYSPSFVRPVCGLRLTRARFSFATNSAFSIDPIGSFPRQIIFAYMDNLHIYEYIYIYVHAYLENDSFRPQPTPFPLLCSEGTRSIAYNSDRKVGRSEEEKNRSSGGRRDAIAFCRTNDGRYPESKEGPGQGLVDNSKGTRDPRGKWKKSEA